MSKIFIAIDFGHLGADSGAVRKENGKVVAKEVDLNTAIATKIVSVLENHGVQILKTTGSLSNRTNLANKNKVDYFVSIHNNAGGGDGFGAYTYGTGGQAAKLAKAITDQVVTVDKLNNPHGNPLKVANFHVLRETKMPAVLLECAFMDSADYEAVNNPKKLENFGLSIAKGILKYLGITYKEKPVQANSDGFYRVVTGSFKDKATALKRVRELEKVGFESFIDYFKK